MPRYLQIKMVEALVKRCKAAGAAFANGLNTIKSTAKAVYPYLTSAARFYASNFFIVNACTCYVAYFAHYRAKWFIDRENGELHTTRIVRQAD